MREHRAARHQECDFLARIERGGQPDIQVDPETYLVTADGVPLVCEPASVLPMAQRYFLF